MSLEEVQKLYIRFPRIRLPEMTLSYLKCLARAPMARWSSVNKKQAKRNYSLWRF